MKLKEAIERAIENGWKHYGTDIPICDNLTEVWYIKNGDGEHSILYVEVMLFDPKFWQALGKNEGWETTPYGDYYSSEAEFRHHDFLINLWAGGTIETAFELATA